MKILVLIQCANLGGMEQSTVLLLDEFLKMGHEVELLSLNEIGALGPVLEQHGIPASAVGYCGNVVADRLAVSDPDENPYLYQGILS